MAQAQLIQNVKLKDEYGVTFPTALLLVLDANLNDTWSMSAEQEGDEYTEENSVGGGTYQAWYYCSPQARALGVPLKPLRTFEDGGFNDVMIVDTVQAEIKQLLDSPAAKRDKVIAIIKKDLEIKSR